MEQFKSLDRKILWEKFWATYKKNLKMFNTLAILPKTGKNADNAFIDLLNEKDKVEIELGKIKALGKSADVEFKERLLKWEDYYNQTIKDIEMARENAYRTIYTLTVLTLKPVILKSSVEFCIPKLQIDFTVSLDKIENVGLQKELIVEGKQKLFKKVASDLSIRGNQDARENFTVHSSALRIVTVRFLGFNRDVTSEEVDMNIKKYGRWLWPEEMLYLSHSHPEIALVAAYPTFAQKLKSLIKEEDQLFGEMVMCQQLMYYGTTSNLMEDYEKSMHWLALFPEKRTWSQLCVFPYVPNTK